MADDFSDEPPQTGQRFRTSTAKNETPFSFAKIRAEDVPDERAGEPLDFAIANESLGHVPVAAERPLRAERLEKRAHLMRLRSNASYSEYTPKSGVQGGNGEIEDAERPTSHPHEHSEDRAKKAALRGIHEAIVLDQDGAIERFSEPVRTFLTSSSQKGPGEGR